MKPGANLVLTNLIWIRDWDLKGRSTLRDCETCTGWLQRWKLSNQFNPNLHHMQQKLHICLFLVLIFH